MSSRSEIGRKTSFQLINDGMKVVIERYISLYCISIFTFEMHSNSPQPCFRMATA
jgi:hypothetical protein